MTFGTALKEAREAQGISLQDMALRTKIRPDYLEALEDGNLAQLPERTFVRSFVQRYARELQIDAEPLLADLERVMPNANPVVRNPTTTTRVSSAPGRSSRRSGINPLLVSLLLTGLIVLGAGGYLIASNIRNRAVETKPAPVQPAPEPPVSVPKTVRLTVTTVPDGARVYLDNRELGHAPVRSFPVEARKGAILRVEYGDRLPFKQAIDVRTGRNLRIRLLPVELGPSMMTDLATGAVQASMPVSVPKQNSATVSPPVASGVSLSFTADSWLRVTNAGGQVLYVGIVPAGSQRSFPNGVTIRAGNAGAVRVSVNGAPATTMGAPDQPVTRRY